MTNQPLYTREQVNDITAAVARQLSTHYQAAITNIFNELYDAGIELSSRLGLTDDFLGAEYEQWADEHDARYEWPEA